MPSLQHPPRLLYEPLLQAALREDLGRAGDVTTGAIVAREATSRAVLVARQPGRIAGLQVALDTFRLLDPGTDAQFLVADGQDAAAGSELALIHGRTRALLSGERVALNLLGHLSGIATATREIASRIAHTAAKVCCTRKTTPGLRTLEKYAVRAGGGSNHRFGLDDAILIKDNHIVAAGGLGAAIAGARAVSGHMLKIEVEVENVDQLEEALRLGVDAVLLDNMTPADLRIAVSRASGKAILEASGGITLDTAAAFAETGVDVLSAGWLTHSAPALDVALDILPEERALSAASSGPNTSARHHRHP